jgi:glycosyltransferase 2 family protein
MDEKVKKNLFLAVRIIVPVVLIFLLFRNLDWAAVLKALHGYPIWILAISVLSYILANILFGFRWYYILKSVDIDIPFTYVISLVFYSLFLSNFLPTTIGGDLVKMVGVVNKGGPQKRTIKISSVVADRIFSFASKLLLLPLTVWIFRDYLAIGFNLPWLQSAFLLNKLPKNFREKLAHYLKTIRPWFKPGKLASVLGISWVSLIVNILSFWLVIRALNPSVSAVQVFCVTLLTYFASILPITINGIGVQEGSITYLLTLIGFSYEQGIAAALLIRLITIVVSLLGGVWLMIGGRDLWQVLQSGKASDLTKDMEKNDEGADE